MTRKMRERLDKNKPSFVAQVRSCVEAGASGSVRPINPPRVATRNMAPKGGFNAHRCS